MPSTINCEVSSSVFKKLEKVAKESKESQSIIVNKALEYYFAELKDLKISKKRLSDSSDSLVSMQDMRTSLGI